ncbi:MAG TPA: hypothetical protein VF173_33010 [Thermoanaerobaculia bacterium]|nr:hypothetical protein [Thermoanaerobaculia bacterium]
MKPHTATSKRPQRTLTLAALILAGLSLSLAGPAAALLCENAAANASLVLGPAKHSVKSTSSGGGYATVSCKNFVVDISVPSNSSGTGTDLKSFSIWTNFENPVGAITAKAACLAFSDQTLVYKKAGGAGQFQMIGSWQRSGSWTDPTQQNGILFPCTIQTKPGAILLPTLNPPANGADLYRVVTIRKSGTTPQTVIVEADHDSPAPPIPR